MSVNPRLVGIGMLTLVLVLIIALAYNMGGSAQESKDTPLIELTGQRITTTSRRLAQCKGKLDRLQGEQRHTDDVAAEVQHTIDGFASDTKVLEAALVSLQSQLDTCQKTKDAEQTAWDDGPENTMEDRIRQLQSEVAAANQTLDSVVMNRIEDDQDMLRLLLAFRRANEALAKKVAGTPAPAPTPTTAAPAAQTAAATDSVTVVSGATTVAAAVAADGTTPPPVTPTTSSAPPSQ